MKIEINVLHIDQFDRNKFQEYWTTSFRYFLGMLLKGEVEHWFIQVNGKTIINGKYRGIPGHELTEE